MFFQKNSSHQNSSFTILNQQQKMFMYIFNQNRYQYIVCRLESATDDATLERYESIHLEKND